MCASPPCPLNVLIVEDSKLVRDLLRMELEDCGFQPLTAATPEQAQWLLETQGDQIDLVLMDMVLPGISGLELFEQLQRKKPDIQAIFMSGYSAEELGRLQGLPEGIPFLRKPFDGQKLSRLINRMFPMV